MQGHLLLNDGKLYLAGGNAVSPGIYDASNGKCLINGDFLDNCQSVSIRGWELYLIGDKIVVGGQPFYGDPNYSVMDATVFEKALHTTTGEKDILWMNDNEIRCYNPIDKKILNNCVSEREFPGNFIVRSWGKLDIENKPVWEHKCEGSVAVALCKNAVVVAKENEVIALDLKDGKTLWKHPLPVSPVRWGIAVGSNGHIILTLKNGSVICIG